MTAWTADRRGVDVWFGDEVFTLSDPHNKGVTIVQNGTLPPRAMCWCGVALELSLEEGAVHHAAPDPDSSTYSASSRLRTPPCDHWV